MKISDVVEFAKTRLYQQFDAGELRAVTQTLLQYFWQTSPTDYFVNGDKFIDGKYFDDFCQAVDELEKNRPLQYVLGETYFCGLRFFVDENVLIPRPETEELTNMIIAENMVGARFLDVCTGSGCIAVSLAKKIKNAEVHALDISPQAIEKAKQNAAYNNVEVKFICADFLANEHFVNMKFDCIVSNPPYVRESEKAQMQKNVLDYEPPIALFVPDNDALKFYNAIANFALQHLNKNGRIYLEINANLARETSILFQQKGFKNVEIIKDLSGKDRFIKINC